MDHRNFDQTKCEFEDSAESLFVCLSVSEAITLEQYQFHWKFIEVSSIISKLAD